MISNKICVALLSAGMLFTANVLSVHFLVRNEGRTNLELTYRPDTSSMDEGDHQIVPISLPSGHTWEFDNDSNSWSIQFEDNGQSYSIVRFNEMLKVGGMRQGRRTFLYGGRDGENFRVQPDVAREIVIDVRNKNIHLNLFGAPLQR